MFMCVNRHASNFQETLWYFWWCSSKLCWKEPNSEIKVYAKRKVQSCQILSETLWDVKGSNPQSSYYLPRTTVCLLWIIISQYKKSLFLFSTFCRWNPGNPCVMSSVSVQWFPVKPLLAPLLMVHSLCPQQMWHAVSTVPSKLAAELSPAWKTQLVTQMACMTSASPSYTVLLNLTLRYTLLFIPTYAYTSLSLWAGVDHMGVTVRAKTVWTTSVFFFFPYRVKHLWRRALSALPMASPRRHSPPSDAAPPSKEWYPMSKRSVTASWISAPLPDSIQMLLVKWHSYPATSPIGGPHYPV